MLKDKDINPSICSIHDKSPEEEDGDDPEVVIDSINKHFSKDEDQLAEDANVKKNDPKTNKNKKELFCSLLDWEFQNLLHIVRPYVALRTTVQDETRVAKWLQKLYGV